MHLCSRFGGTCLTAISRLMIASTTCGRWGRICRAWSRGVMFLSPIVMAFQADTCRSTWKYDRSAWALEILVRFWYQIQCSGAEESCSAGLGISAQKEICWLGSSLTEPMHKNNTKHTMFSEQHATAHFSQQFLSSHHHNASDLSSSQGIAQGRAGQVTFRA